MKHSIYKFTAIFFLSIIITACNNGKPHSNDDGHSHGEMPNENPEASEHHDNEVVLTDQQFKALKIKADTLAFRTMGGYVEAVGTLEVPPQNEAAITSVIGANITAIKVIEGDKVGKGQAVAYLSHPNIVSLQTDYLNAYSNSALLKKNYERQQKLYGAGVGSGANFQKAEAEYQASTALVNGLAAQLKILNLSPSAVQKGNISTQVALLSPIEGFVQKVEIKTGQYVEPQTKLFEIVNTHHIHADFMVFEKDAHKVKKGQTVQFTLQSLPNEVLTATIYSVGKTFEDEPKAIHLHAEIENKKEHLIPGMYLQGKIQTDSVQTKALPESAIIADGDKFYVFLVENEGADWSFTPIEVLVGEKDSGWAAVTFLDEIAPNTKFSYNNAYYLLAEMKKGETEHTH